MIQAEDVKRSINYAAYYRQNVQIVHERGQEWTAVCPFHEDSERDPHLSINIQTGLFCCHKCGRKGDVFAFHQERYGVNFKQALAELGRFVGVTEPTSSSTKRKKKANLVAVPSSPQKDQAVGGQIDKSATVDVISVYEAFMAGARLTDAHRAELRTKRGFSEETIRFWRFVSGGPHNRELLEDIKSRFDPALLIASGVFVEVNGTLVPAKPLLEDRVIIPFLDEHGRVTLLRPHKMYLLHVKLQPYCRAMLASRPSEIVLTEGEFKAAALHQWGIPALALPGVSSFSGKYFEELCGLLREFGVSKVTICFDNEVKDDPRFPNYKQRPDDRWDTPYYAYIMAWKLMTIGQFQTQIATLPDEWRVNGKADFDGALAAGHTAEEIRAILFKAVGHQEYLESLPDEARRVVKRKLARYFLHSPVRREHNRYVIDRPGRDAPDVVSNFVMDIVASFYAPDGCVRHVRFTNEFGEQSEAFPIEPANMAGLGEFSTWCLARGNYIFKGKGSDLREIWEYELARDTGDMIVLPERIGETKLGLWLFGNVAIKNGKAIFPDDSGVFWVDGVGYKPRVQEVNTDATGDGVSLSHIPTLCLSIGRGQSLSFLEVADRLRRAYGTLGAYLGVGFVIGTIFSRPIFQALRMFPFLFVCGKRESGKTSFVQLLLYVLGIESEGVSLAESSTVGLTRTLGYYASLPAWFDEYRNNAKVTQKDGYLRSAYNRQGVTKGVKDSFGIRSYAVASTLILSGEELPKDNGLLTRCVPVQISEFTRDREEFEALLRMAPSLSWPTYQLLLHYDEYKDRVIETILELRDALTEQGISDRTAANWAVAAGAFSAVIKEDPEFIQWVLQACQEIKRSNEEEHMLNVFLQDLAVLAAEKELDRAHFKVCGDKLAIWLNGVYNKWAEYYRRRTGESPFDRLTILKYLKDEPYYRGEHRSIRFEGKAKKCYLVEIASAPDAVREIADEIGIDADVQVV